MKMPFLFMVHCCRTGELTYGASIVHSHELRSLANFWVHSVRPFMYMSHLARSFLQSCLLYICRQMASALWQVGKMVSEGRIGSFLPVKIGWYFPVKNGCFIPLLTGRADVGNQQDNRGHEPFLYREGNDIALQIA